MDYSFVKKHLLDVRLESLIGSLLFAACFLSMMFQLVGGEAQVVIREIAVVSGSMLLLILIGKNAFDLRSVQVGIILILFILVDAYWIGAKEIAALMQMCISFVMGMFLVRRGILLTVARAIFWTVLISMAYLYSTSVNNYEIFPTQGRNFCGAYALLAFMVLASAVGRKEARVTNELMISSVACLALSVFAVGRGSILACALLVALVFSLRYKEHRGSASKALYLSMILVGIAVVFLIVMLLNADALNQIFARFGSVSADRSDEARTTLYTDYLKAIFENKTALLFGMDPRRIVNATIIATGGNLHCSYLQWHANFGLAGLLVLVSVVLLGLRRLWIDGQRVACVAAAAVFFRALTDTMLVGGIWDVAFFYLLFSIISHDKRESELRRHGKAVPVWAKHGLRG